jgi:RNA-binding protein
MKELTGAQRKHLRSLAHHLDPICFVGKSGLTEAVTRSVDLAFDAHELLKVKFIDRKEEKKELTARIAESTESHCVGLIGNIAILYRCHPDPGKRRIELPDA